MADFERVQGLAATTPAPSQALVTFLDDLLRLLPENGLGVWASSPMGEVAGDSVVLPLTYGSRLESAMVSIVDLAHAHNLVCADLSAEDVYPPYEDGTRYADHFAESQSSTNPANEVYVRFIRDVISPSMRKLGFQGSAGEYRLKEANKNHALVGFQKDHDASAWQVAFTVNLVHITADAWRKARETYTDLPKRPNTRVQWPASGWYERLGQFIDPPEDRWWVIKTQNDVPEVADQVIMLMRDRAVPELRRRLNEASATTGNTT